MHRWVPSVVLTIAVASSVLTSGCSSTSRSRYATTNETLKLTRVVLYRNGVGYFERSGPVEGDLLTIRVRKDQVNDLLKSLTVVERKGGRAVSVSMPLDPQTWANAALATLGPGKGSLAQVLDALRGTEVTLSTATGSAHGRIMMVEPIEEATPRPGPQGAPEPRPPTERDYRVTLIGDTELEVVRLSNVTTVTLTDGDLAMQFHRSLDATAGEGMFQQVDVAIRLAGASGHDLALSYVVSAPMWKPTYRVVLPEKGKGKALLQGWAVVDNTSGEDWRDVRMSLTSGAPIAFKYDLHTPRDVERTNLTESGVRRQARATVGETTFGGEAAEPPPPAPPPPPPGAAAALEQGIDADDETRAEAQTGAQLKEEKEANKKKDKAGGPVGKATTSKAPPRGAPAPPRAGAPPPAKPSSQPVPLQDATPAAPPAIDAEGLRRSTLANARASQASGLVRFDLGTVVTVPDGTSTMVALINQEVDGEETFLYTPGGAGVGYEANPYRVVRFRNTTPFVLEPGPISIYAAGSFVGEGLSETVGTRTSATIPFAVEPGILVTQSVKTDGDEMRLLRIVRGVLEVESFARKTTTWTAKSQQRKPEPFAVLIRHPRAGWNYQLAPRPEGTEDLPEAYLVPLKVAASAVEGAVTVIEQTPSRTSLAIWDARALPLLETLLVSTALPADAKKKLEPIVTRRQAIGKIDTQIDGLKRQQVELDQRANETRANLQAIKKDPAAAALRKRLSDRLDQFTRDGDRIGREIVELQSKRLEQRVELEDMLQTLDLSAPTAPPAPKPPPKPR